MPWNGRKPRAPLAAFPTLIDFKISVVLFECQLNTIYWITLSVFSINGSWQSSKSGSGEIEEEYMFLEFWKFIFL